MFGSLIRTMSGPIVTDSLLAFHLSGSLLNVVSILIGHVISGPSSSDRGKLTDAAPRLTDPPIAQAPESPADDYSGTE